MTRIINCPHCDCFYGPKRVRGNIPCMICTTCESVFMTDENRTILKRGNKNDNS